MARTVATTRPVDLDELLDFVRPRHRMLLATMRSDGRPQLSPVSGGVDAEGRIIISTYPARAKTVNAERDSRTSVCVLSDEWNGPWVQVDGTAEVLHMPDALDALVDYYRCLAGEHPDWDEYRAAMVVQDKSLLRITPHALGSARDRRVPGRRRGPAGRRVDRAGVPRCVPREQDGPVTRQVANAPLRESGARRRLRSWLATATSLTSSRTHPRSSM